MDLAERLMRARQAWLAANLPVGFAQVSRDLFLSIEMSSAFFREAYHRTVWDPERRWNTATLWFNDMAVYRVDDMPPGAILFTPDPPLVRCIFDHEDCDLDRELAAACTGDAVLRHMGYRPPYRP